MEAQRREVQLGLAPMVQEVMVAPLAAGTWTLSATRVGQAAQGLLVRHQVVVSDREAGLELMEPYI